MRLTTAQALIRFLEQQHIERDGVQQPFFGGCFGIFGHGNVAGIGEALAGRPSFRYYQAKNEQAMVHTAAAYAKMHDRLRAFACTTSVGPGATNMITAAAGATINRLPVLLLPGDIFAHRRADPVLQQLESSRTRDVSVNDCFVPVSKFWDRIWRPEQLSSSLMDAMRVLTCPAETGAVTLCLPQDVQIEAHDFDDRLFERRVWSVPRTPPADEMLQQAVEWIRSSRRPMIIAGGGVIYSGACGALASLCKKTGIPVGETQAGRGALDWDHAQSLGATGATGSLAANATAQDADLIIGIGTRYSDFTTASNSAFGHADVRFININVASLDAAKQGALPIVADARVTLERLTKALAKFRVSKTYATKVAALRDDWTAEVERLRGLDIGPPLAQSKVIGLVNDAAGDRGVVVCAAGSLPGDLHKMWRPKDPKSYHVEYGYSCMGYEIAGGLGVKMAAPDREVFVMVGDGSYLMMAQELVTAAQEGLKITVVLLDNHGFCSIGGLSESIGSGGFGTEYRRRDDDGRLGGEHLPVDFVANAQSLGVEAVAVSTAEELQDQLTAAKDAPGTSVIVVSTARDVRVPGYQSWWDVPVAEVSDNAAVQTARATWEEAVKKQRRHI